MLLCLIGPAGGGKTTFCDRLLAHYGSSMELSVSVTTRAPRPNEINGKSYHFVTAADFAARVEKGEFYEWEEIHGNRYGTLRQSVDHALSGNRDLLLDVDIKGALNFKKALPNNTIVVFLVPPSIGVLRTRLQGRGAISQTELDTRMKTAEREYRQLLELADKPGAVDYFVVNDVAETTYQALEAIVIAERARLIRLAKEDVKAICKL
jgi:guanylate kinase